MNGHAGGENSNHQESGGTLDALSKKRQFGKTPQRGDARIMLQQRLGSS